MERKDWTIPALLCEAVCGILEFVYILLQIYYGITYHVGIYKPVLNILKIQVKKVAQKDQEAVVALLEEVLILEETLIH